MHPYGGGAYGAEKQCRENLTIMIERIKSEREDGRLSERGQSFILPKRRIFKQKLT